MTSASSTSTRFSRQSHLMEKTVDSVEHKLHTTLTLCTLLALPIRSCHSEPQTAWIPTHLHGSPGFLLGDLHVVVHVVVSHGVLGHVGDQELLAVNSTAKCRVPMDPMEKRRLKDLGRNWKCLDLFKKDNFWIINLMITSVPFSQFSP